MRISWADDNTLKIETDYGMQTRLLQFSSAATPPPARSWQGTTSAQWSVKGGGRGGQRYGSLKTITTNLRPGYLRKNGVPYSEDASITEYFDRLPPHPNGDVWMLVLTIVEDPQYLTQPFYTSTHFKLERDGTKWNPTPCRTDPPAK